MKNELRSEITYLFCCCWLSCCFLVQCLELLLLLLETTLGNQRFSDMCKLYDFRLEKIFAGIRQICNYFFITKYCCCILCRPDCLSLSDETKGPWPSGYAPNANVSSVNQVLWKQFHFQINKVVSEDFVSPYYHTLICIADEQVTVPYSVCRLYE